MSQTFGPYNSERDAIADSRDVANLPPASGAWSRANALKVYVACQQAGVELGAYDEQIITWLSRWEPQAVQVIVGLISRAGAK